MRKMISTIHRMFQFTKGCRGRYFLGMVCYTSQIFTANYIHAIFLSWLSAAILARSETDMRMAVLKFIILFILQLIVTLVGISFYNISTIKIEKNLKCKVFHNYLLQEESKAKVRHSAEAVSKLNIDTELALQCLGNRFALIVFSLFTLLGSSAIIFFIDYRIGLVEVAIGVCALYVQVRYVKPTKTLSQKSLEANEASIKIVSNALRGMDTVRVNQYENQVFHSYEEILKSIFQFSQAKTVLLTYQAAFTNLFGWFSIIGVFGMGIYFINQGKLDFPTFIMLPTLCAGLISSMTDLGSQITGLQAPIAAAERLFETFSEEEVENEFCNLQAAGVKKRIINDTNKDALKVKTLNLTTMTSHIQIKGLKFSYDGKKQLEVDELVIPHHSTIALVGESGSGKSTLLKLLIGLNSISDGTIMMDGQSMMNVEKESWKRLFAYVDQECRLFHMSVMDNIKVGNRLALDEEVFEAAIMAGCDEFIRNLNNGYHTMIGENKFGISGGQAQRICIARALLRKSPILVLDEFSSSLDAENEKKIVEQILKLKQHYTIIFATHNMDLANQADQIYRVEAMSDVV